MDQVLHVHASRATRKLLSADSSNLFLVQGYWESKSVDLQPVGFANVAHVYGAINHQQAMSMLANSFSVWARFPPRRGNLENYLRVLQRWVVKIYADMKALGVRAVIFHTSSPHHPSTICIEVASRLLGLRTVYLYTEWIAGRLLPVETDFPNGGLAPVQCDVGSYDYSDKIHEFQSRSGKGLAPAFGEGPRFASDSSLVLSAIVDLSLRFARGILRRKRLREFEGTFEYEVDPDYRGRPAVPWTTEVSIMFSQWRALRLLRKRSGTAVSRRPGGGNVVFYGHFQPEASSFPEQGVVFSDMPHSLAVLQSSQVGGVLTFREHPENFKYARRGVPTRVGISRTPEFVDRLVELGVETDIAEQSRSDSSEAVAATLAGSIALERSLMGRATIVTGEPWYGRVPGTVRPEEIADLGELKSMEASGSIRDAAERYLLTRLNNRTITNIQGIGGVPAAPEWDDAVRYVSEMRALSQFLMRDAELLEVED